MPNLERIFDECDTGQPYIVAEMACAHEGSVDRATEIVQVSSPADAVQVQLFHAGKLVLKSEAESVRKFELEPASWKRVADRVEDEGLDLWATVFDEEAIDLALQLDADVLKIHSTDLSNPFLLQATAEAGIPVSLSVGGSYVSEIQSALNTLEQHGVDRAVLMHGFQAFPTAPKDARLGFISTLDRLFPYPVGYQDHTDGASELAYSLPLAALGLGARVIEKHIIDDRSHRGTDFESALGPESFRQFVEMIDHTNGVFSGRRPDVFSEAEREYRQSMKRRIAARVDIPQGTTISEDFLALRRADEGLKANALETVVGRRSDRRIQSGDVVTEEDLV